MLQVIHTGQALHVPKDSGVLPIGTLQVGDLIPHHLPRPDITTRKDPWAKVLSFGVTPRKDRQDPDNVDVKNLNLSLKNIWSKPGVVDQACNPSYTGGRDGKDRVC
jgi:hypothetical protein